MGPQVAMFIPSLRHGGAEVATVNLVRGLHDAGVPVQVVCARTGGQLSGRIPAGVPLTDLGAGRVLRAIRPLALWLKEHRPTVLIAGMVDACLAAAVAVRLGWRPDRVVFVEHIDPRARAAAFRSLRERMLPLARSLAYRQADAVVAVSEGAARSLRRLRGRGRSRVEVIPNAVDVAGITARARAGEAPPGRYLVSVGRLVPQKGHLDLLRAFADVARRHDVHLWILGDGPQRRTLVDFARSVGLADRVHLPGYRPNPYPVMVGAQALVSASRYEGLPLVLIEALACGVPVVATDCPSGPRDILDGGRYGLLVPVGMPGHLAGAIDRVLSDRALAADLSARGPARAEEYSIPRVTDRYLRLFRDLGVDLVPAAG